MERNKTFGEAIEALKNGKRVQREGWNGKGMFVFMQVPATIGKEIVPKMQSLPQTVKDEFKRRFDLVVENTKEGAMAANWELEINYSNQMAIVSPKNEISGWSPSSADTLATDWTILD
jgi:hypothetical protein